MNKDEMVVSKGLKMSCKKFLIKAIKGFASFTEFTPSFKLFFNFVYFQPTSKLLCFVFKPSLEMLLSVFLSIFFICFNYFWC